MTREQVREMLTAIGARIVFDDEMSIEIDSMTSYGCVEFAFDERGILRSINSFE